MKKEWQPLKPSNLQEIEECFNRIFPRLEYDDLSDRIFLYWKEKLKAVWEKKEQELKSKDLGYNPEDPLSRIEQKIVVIAYADSVSMEGEKTLVTLNRFLKKNFPAIGGIHLLPACKVNENRFNDGFFSQVVRNQVHETFGDNAVMAEIMKKYFSMADFVLNHVDIDNPLFSAYLNGDEAAGKCFYIFSEEEYQQRKAAGDFDKVFRPRPFPLFSIFRRKPESKKNAEMDMGERFKEIADLPSIRTDPPLIGIFSLFNKIKNDQMLLSEDYKVITGFIEYIKKKGIEEEKIFTVSETQEVRHIPYVFIP